MHENDTYTWKIVDTRMETPLVTSFFLSAEGERPQFISGQYLTVRLAGFEPSEGKSYSIVSTPNDALVTLTVKRMGAFSEALLAHRVGDTLTTSLPYGFFYPDTEETCELVFLAGGIGITPIMSMLRALLMGGYSEQLSLYYSVPHEADTVFRDTLDALNDAHANFSCTYFVTREEPARANARAGRITMDALAAHRERVCNYFLSGSIEFTKGMWHMLREGGVPQNQIYTEGFF